MFFKIFVAQLTLITLQIELVEKEVISEELEVFNQILTVKE